MKDDFGGISSGYATYFGEYSYFYVVIVQRFELKLKKIEVIYHKKSRR